MDILVLIACQLFTVPFLQEAERLGRIQRSFPHLLDIARLGHVRDAAWFRPFCALAAVFVGAVFAITFQDETPEVLGFIVATALVQMCLWTVVVLNVRRHARTHDARTARPALRTGRPARA